jgi:acetyl-CoA C-acetyltransferase
MMKQSVLVAARRSPIGKYLGTLSRMKATQLGAEVAKATLADINAQPDDIDEAFIGCVLQAALGQNPARQVALGAGLPETITALTLNKVCGSGLESVTQADRAIRCGDLDAALCGGIESMSQVPYYVSGARAGLKFGDGSLVDGMQHDGLTCVFEGWAMGCAAEHIAERFDVDRDAQDQCAVDSHLKAAAAQKAGHFTREIVAIQTRDGAFDADETVRAAASMDNARKLPTVFKKNGTVTAGNASALSDGAAMTIVASQELASKKGWPIRAKLRASTTAGVAPKELFYAPVLAIRDVIDKAGIALSDVDLFEINEAFAAQTVANVKALELDPAKVNVHGGAIALGHPIGASGTRVLVTLLHAMETRDAKLGIAALCLGGGNAVAICIERELS